VEIWNPDQWRSVISGVEGDPDTFVSQLADLGI